MQTYTAVLALALVAAGPISLGAAQKETETFDRTIPFAQGTTLRLRSFSGDVRITGGPGTDVVIHAVRRATRDRLDNIKLDVQVQGDRIEIEANRKSSTWRQRDDNVVETEFEIQVPARIAVDVSLFSGNVTVQDVDGREKLNAFSGNLTVRNGAGEIDAETFSGGIDLDLSSAPEVPSIRVKTFSGDVKARLPQSGGGQLEFSGFSGNLRSDVPLTLRRSSKRNVSAEIGSGSARLTFNTFSGDVRLLK